MAIIVRLDVMLATRKMKSKDLASKIGISEQNLSLLKSGKVPPSARNLTASPVIFLNLRNPDKRQAPSSTEDECSIPHAMKLPLIRHWLSSLTSMS